jgi:hypothetical protein
VAPESSYRLRLLRNAVILLAGLTLASGCRKEQITVYRVPKENPTAFSPAPRAETAHSEEGTRSLPRLRWTLPAGWEEQAPSGMSVAGFLVRWADGKRAEVSVLPFPGEGASDLRLMVNIVREKAGLQPISSDELSKAVEPVAIGDVSAKLVDLTGATAAASESSQSRIVLAVLPKDGITWFFKLAGDGAVVSSQKSAFVNFLKTVTFEPGPGVAPNAGQVAEANALSSETAERPARPSWEVPAGWQEVPGSEELLAKFAVSDSEGKAEVTVSSFAGMAGGLAANVNRWRGQLGLSPLSTADAEKEASSLDVLGGKAMLVDMTGEKGGQKTRLTAVIVPREGQTWFYKLMGHASVAEREKAAFIKFVPSVRYPNA